MSALRTSYTLCTDRDIRGFTLSDIVNLKQSNCVMRITQIFSEVKWLFTFVVPISLYTIDIFGSQLVHSMALCALSISSLVPSLCNVHSCHSEIASKCYGWVHCQRGTPVVNYTLTYVNLRQMTVCTLCSRDTGELLDSHDAYPQVICVANETVSL